MDLLSRAGGLSGAEIGGILGVGYSAVIPGQKTITRKNERRQASFSDYQKS